MKINDYIRQHDSLIGEQPLFDIPVRKEYLLRAIGRGKRVLDLGCLGGRISRLIKDQNNEVYGVELNGKAAELAESRGIRVKVFDLNEGIPYEDRFFDVVNAGDLLGQVYDTRSLFEEIHRVLKTDGRLILTAPNLNSLGNRLRILSGGYLSSVGAYPDDHSGNQIRVFNLAKIRELCVYTGFEIEEVRGVAALAGGLGFRLLQPFMRIRPQLGELLIVKARRLSARRPTH
jgi:methionine biosynthesis protein MetW